MAIEENVVELSGGPSTQNSVTGVNSDQPFANKHVNIRLDDFNFLLWKQHVMLMIRGHDLEQYLDESTVVPPKVLTNSDGQLVLNPAYRRFKKEDYNLSSWLLSTISPNILPQLVSADSTAAIWNTILKLYSKLSTTKIMNLHCRLRALKKGSLTIREYTTQVKEICDLLATSGSPVSYIEQIATVLNGLPVEFKPFVAAITVSREPYTFESVTSVLMDAESRILDPMRMPMGINVTRYSADSNSESVETEGSQVHMSDTNSPTATEEDLSARMPYANSPVVDVSEEGLQAQVPVTNSPTATDLENGLSAQLSDANSPVAVVPENSSTATVPVSEAVNNTGAPTYSNTEVDVPLEFDSTEDIADEFSPHVESNGISLPARGEEVLASHVDHTLPVSATTSVSRILLHLSSNSFLFFFISIQRDCFQKAGSVEARPRDVKEDRFPNVEGIEPVLTKRKRSRNSSINGVVSKVNMLKKGKSTELQSELVMKQVVGKVKCGKGSEVRERMS
ncbi:hypothetical protein GQ457_07G016460 [Hibiscus cannabinus]